MRRKMSPIQMCWLDSPLAPSLVAQSYIVQVHLLHRLEIVDRFANSRCIYRSISIVKSVHLDLLKRYTIGTKEILSKRKIFKGLFTNLVTYPSIQSSKSVEYYGLSGVESMVQIFSFFLHHPFDFVTYSALRLGLRTKEALTHLHLRSTPEVSCLLPTPIPYYSTASLSRSPATCLHCHSAKPAAFQTEAGALGIQGYSLNTYYFC